MRKIFPVVILFSLTSVFAFEQTKPVERLRQVRTVYVADLGKTAMPQALRREIIKTIDQSKRVDIVNSPEQADAILDVAIKRGTKNVDRSLDVWDDPQLKTGSRVVDTEEMVFSLLSGQSRTLWSLKLDVESFAERNETEAVRVMARKISREFLKALERDAKKRS
jgi:hypothetical protein